MQVRGLRRFPTVQPCCPGWVDVYDHHCIKISLYIASMLRSDLIECRRSNGTCRWHARIGGALAMEALLQGLKEAAEHTRVRSMALCADRKSTRLNSSH